mmetsp:Transcript_3249/g.12166  ORF Transcript_3249/g.12166 Transcript_3249/m.12166 type:complete len:460 (-) Transcript_3249:702-2081(-)
MPTSFPFCSAYSPTVCSESRDVLPGVWRSTPLIAALRSRIDSFSKPFAPKTDMSSACITSKRSCSMFMLMSGPAAPGEPMRDTLSLALITHPFVESKLSTKTCPSVMDMNSSTRGLGCVWLCSGACFEPRAETALFFSCSCLNFSACCFFTSIAAVIFSRICADISPNPAGSCGTTTLPLSPTTPLFFSLAAFPLYAPVWWYITPIRVKDPPPSLSFMRATRCSVIPRNRRRSANKALMIIPSYSTICSFEGAFSDVSSSKSSCGDSRPISREKPMRPVKSSSTSNTSFPNDLAASATANAAHVAAYRSVRDASGAQETTVVSVAPASCNVFIADAPESKAAAPIAPYTHRTFLFAFISVCATIAFIPSWLRLVPTSPVSSKHCPRPIGVRTSSGFTPVTSGVLMGFRSSTLGGSRNSCEPAFSESATSRPAPPGMGPPSRGSPSAPIRLPTTSSSLGM